MEQRAPRQVGDVSEPPCASERVFARLNALRERDREAFDAAWDRLMAMPKPYCLGTMALGDFVAPLKREGEPC